jgi:ABC-type uncharacterized transport system
MNTPPPSKPRRIRRFWIGVNVVRQILIMIAIVAMINYLGFNWYQRWDLSRNHKYTLSSLTHNVLNSLTKDVAIFVFFSPASRNLSSQLYDDVQNLLREYDLAGHRRVHVESIDPYRDLTRARAIEAKYQLGSQENLVIIDYQGHTKILHLADLAEYDQTGASSNTPQIRAFRGEQAITSALTELIEGTLVRIGVIMGHGEPSVAGDTPLNQLRQYVERQNMRLEALPLEGISPDYGALLLVGPKYDLNEHDLALLRKFWNEQGRLLVLLDPKVKTPKLNAFLADFGVRPDPNVIVTKIKPGIEESSNNLDVYAQFLPETSFLRSLSQVNGYFPGGTCSLSIDESKIAQSGITASRALTPVPSEYWGSRNDVLNLSNVPGYRPGIDFPPPLFFGVALEKGAIRDVRVQVKSSSRMLIVGNADFLRDDALTQSAPNLDFALLSLNWLTDRERFLAIAPKTPRSFTLNLSNAQMNRIVLITVGGLPLLVGLLGVAVWTIRRR